MNVLSLFDGVSCGQLALQRLGIKVDNYFASEIDKYAIKTCLKNFPDTIQIGDVVDVKGSDLPGIDLILAGSPCTGFSFAGKQLNFKDKQSKLFFDFIRLLKECKPKYFLLENVKMKKEYMDIITKHVGVEPILINSSLVSAQNRKRLYWTNIEGVAQPEDKKKYLRDILLSGEPFSYSTSGRGDNGVESRISSTEKAHTLTQGGYGNRSFSGAIDELKHTDKALAYMDRKVKGGRNHWDFKHHSDYRHDKSATLVANLHKGVPYNVLIDKNKVVRKLHPIECERLQTVPENYTEGVSATQRYRQLGNGWTVDVIAHILKGIK